MSFPEKIKVGEIFVAAGAAFGKMAEMIESIQKAGETSSTGKWSAQEIKMLQSALKPFIAELRRIHSTVKNKKDEEKSAVSDPTDFIDMNEPSTVKAADDKEIAFNESLSELPKSGSAEDTPIIRSEEQAAITSEEQIANHSEEQAALSRAQVFISEGQVFISEEQIPISEEQIPISEEQISICEEEIPISEEQVSICEEEIPISGEQVSITEEGISISEEQLLILSNRRI
ncbi:hypothetical protein CDAR_262611 [Caerostris darwini]|uniref:Uncharacterized protein n=1 Tax=Caerostris darwini TaxID=1538125 RepID=A0AAV4TFQ6_9ARAC|nr:hypothetical protein CDAR_262611 [Caerostris darwini]